METLICPTCGCSLVRLGISKDKATTYSHEGKEALASVGVLLAKLDDSVRGPKITWREFNSPPVDNDRI